MPGNHGRPAHQTQCRADKKCAAVCRRRDEANPPGMWSACWKRPERFAQKSKEGSIKEGLSQISCLQAEEGQGRTTNENPQYTSDFNQILVWVRFALIGISAPLNILNNPRRRT